MGSDLYLARIIRQEAVTGPSAAMFDPDASLFGSLLEELNLDSATHSTFEDYSATLVDWLRRRTILEARHALEDAWYYDGDLAAMLAADPRRVPPNRSYKVDKTWLANQLLSQAHPDKQRAIDALIVTMEVVTIHPDAGLPKPRALMRDFAVRLLTDAQQDQSPIYQRFGAAWAEESFGGDGDDAIAIVPMTACTKYTELEITDEFPKQYEPAWWANESRVRRIEEASDNLPYAVGRYEFLTFPAWVPGLCLGTFDSRAYGFTISR